MSGLREQLDRIVADVPVYGDLDRWSSARWR
jgi:hypothetical protein